MMFLFYIALLFLFNMFLFLDKDFSFFYLNEGKYDLGNEIPMPIVIVIICLLINMGIRIILSDNKNKQKIFEKINETKINSINDTNVSMEITLEKYYKKIIIFSFISILFMILNFFYLVSFGSIFINNQIYVLIRVLYSLIITFIIPFVLCLIYGLIRYLSLRFQIELLYKINLIILNLYFIYL